MVDLIDRDAVISKIKSCISLPADNGWDAGYNTAMAEASQYIQNAPTVNRWIPCSEHMMPDGEKVLMLLTNGEVFVMRRNKNSASDGLRHLSDLSGVKCWMPIPDSYEPTESEVV